MKLLISLYLFVAVLLTQFFVAYFYSKGRTNYRRAFSAFILCVGIYLFGYLMILNNSDPQELIFWNQIQYLGLPFISALWLTVALLYNKTIYALSKPILVLLFIIPVVTFFIRLTNPFHHIFYKNWEIIQVLGNNTLYLERGIWYYIHISYTALCLFITIIIYLVSYLKKREGYTRSQFLIFFFASLLPFIGVVLILLAYNIWSIDYSALIMPISIFIIGYGILKCDFLEVKSLARETVFENSSDGLMILESGLRLIDYNKTAKEFFNSLNISLDTYPIEHILKGEPELLEIFRSETAQEFSLMINGEKRFFEVDVVPLGNPYNKKIRMLKSIRDITEKKRVLEKLTVLAARDSLSGLYNRTEFMKLVQMEFSRSKTQNEELSFLMIDIDFFKTINDAFGHAAGDEVIREMGYIIMSSFRKTDYSGRLGGDEFVILLKNTPFSEAVRTAEKFRETVSNTKVIYDEQEINITVSIGVAAANEDINHSGNIEDVLKQADKALYRAKAGGRNCVATVELYDTELEEDVG